VILCLLPLPSDTQWWSIANLHDPRVTRTSRSSPSDSVGLVSGLDSNNLLQDLVRWRPSISDLKLTCLLNPFSDYSLDWTSPGGPSSSLYYLGHFKNPGLIDWLIEWLTDWQTGWLRCRMTSTKLSVVTARLQWMLRRMRSRNTPTRLNIARSWTSVRSTKALVCLVLLFFVNWLLARVFVISVGTNGPTMTGC